jgi:hypothetical protein
MDHRRKVLAKDLPGDEERRERLEVSLLSLLDGFQYLHRICDGEMCDMIEGVMEWIACPNRASRWTLPNAQVEELEFLDEGRAV